MNPSVECMERLRAEYKAKLLDMRRERVTKALDGLNLHGDSHAMLSQIAYAVHPHVGAWDAESCDHLRNVLAELIGDVREAESDAQHVRACGAGDCDCGNESKEVNDGMAGGGRGMREDSGVGACGRMDYSDVHQEVVGYPSAQYDMLGNERHKAVCELRGISVGALCEKYDYVDVCKTFIWSIGQAIGLRHGAGFEEIIKRLIYLLGGDQSHDSSPTRQENETGIADEPDDDEYYVLDTSKATTIGYEHGALAITNGKNEVRITKDDVIANGTSFADVFDEMTNGAYSRVFRGQSRTCLESESDVPESDDSTSVTSELRKYVCNNETTTTVYAMLPMAPQLKKEQTPNGDKLIAIADRIDGFVDKLSHDVEMWRDRAEDMRKERDDACAERDEMQAKLGELERFDPEMTIYKAMRGKLDLVPDVCESTN